MAGGKEEEEGKEKQEKIENWNKHARFPLLLHSPNENVITRTG